MMRKFLLYLLTGLAILIWGFLLYVSYSLGTLEGKVIFSRLLLITPVLLLMLDKPEIWLVIAAAFVDAIMSVIIAIKTIIEKIFRYAINDSGKPISAYNPHPKKRTRRERRSK